MIVWEMDCEILVSIIKKSQMYIINVKISLKYCCRIRHLVPFLKLTINLTCREVTSIKGRQKHESAVQNMILSAYSSCIFCNIQRFRVLYYSFLLRISAYDISLWKFWEISVKLFIWFVKLYLFWTSCQQLLKWYC